MAAILCSCLGSGGTKYGLFSLNVSDIHCNAFEVLLKVGIEDFVDQRLCLCWILSVHLHNRFRFGCTRAVHYPPLPPDPTHQVVIS